MIFNNHPAALRLVAFALAASLPGMARAQTASAGGAAAPAAAAPISVTGTRTDVPVVLDGLDDDPVWAQAPVMGGFKEARPSENADPKQRT